MAVLIEGGKFIFWILIGDAVTAADLAQCIEHLLDAHPEARVHREEQMLHREIVIAQILTMLFGSFHDGGEFTIHPRFIAALGTGQTIHGFLGPVAHHARGLAQFGEHWGDHGALSGHNGHQQVIHSEFGVGFGFCRGNRRRNGLLGLHSPGLWIKRHVEDSTAENS